MRTLCVVLLRPTIVLRLRHAYDSTEPSSLGFHPEEKKEELFHKQSRLILLHHELDDGLTILAAFCKFRFELGYDDEDSVYW